MHPLLYHPHALDFNEHTYAELQEVVKRFENQGETHKHLEEMKKDYERQIDRLEEERAKYKTEFEDMKYSGDAQVSRFVINRQNSLFYYSINKLY